MSSRTAVDMYEAEPLPQVPAASQISAQRSMGRELWSDDAGSWGERSVSASQATSPTTLPPYYAAS
ncbi:hypothetical protein [Aureliella helgolandensis]|uniref:Uncharacterized protein n=1 Tax=Aureliella helgolandensis TaxID=2527968 RepID=A0A518GD08_9BACT|nr:hypothetical protein [Aureliella helgolandensis]QDV26447.1 hypothetical protein Q31a_48210 [Aureliella helgolandensis]